MKATELEEKLGSRLWRLNNLYKVIDKDGNLIQFRLNHVQKELLKNLWYLNVILKSRQQGITTFICILFLDLALFSENIHCGIVAHRLPDAQTFFDDKIRFAYDNLPEEIRERITLVKDTSMRLVFSNGSKITVGVSLRSGTYQYLHISELGKICAQFPKKALEIKSGALNTIKAGNYIFIESTAEGRSGDFYSYCQLAENGLREGKELTLLDWRFHFFGWTLDPAARLNPEGVTITQELHEYFRELEVKHGLVTDDWQRAWYAKKLLQQGVDMMYREYPATSEEAFFAAIHGAYYKQQMLKLRQQVPPRFATVPWEPKLPVDTAWDLGMDDTTCIVFRQRYGTQNRLIDYHENSGEGLPHYVKVLQDKPYTYGRHYLPHDSKVRSLNDAVSREDKLYELGLRNLVIVERTRDIEDGIEEVRSFLASCWFDQETCQRLINALDEYRKKWNDTTGAFASQPLHNWASNPADAFRCLACGISSNERGDSGNDFLGRGRERGGSWRTA
uniref:Putative DNA packaging protein GP17 (Terminase) n=1 Tax=Geobacter sp. (strain M21) TaxID=443144 RepID=C6E2C1_GEOSM